MTQTSLFAAYAEVAAARGDTPALIDADGTTLSHCALVTLAGHFAARLRAAGVTPGDRVVVQVEKSAGAVALYLGCQQAGAVFVPLNTAYTDAEVGYFLTDCTPALFVHAPGRSTLWPASLMMGTSPADGLWAEALALESDRTITPRGPGDLAAICYTSGTTGRSKGAMLSHGNLLSNARVLKDYWGWRAGDVLIHALPIFHVHGLFVAIHGALLNGSKMIWLGRFDPKKVLEKMPQATVFMGVPTLYVRLLTEPGLTLEAARTMRLFIAGSAPLLIETFTEWQKRTGHTILERYGMSETGMLTSNPYDAGQGARRGGTVGFPLPGVSLRVQDDAGAALPTDEIGGIQVKGPNVFKGYWRMPEKTAEEFTSDGFFRTGDVGKLDALGYVTIVGRSKDLIISGGYNVYPAEVEAYINELPGVEESAVIGVPHPDFGEVGLAVVTAKAGAALDPAQIVASLKATLANFKVPKQCYVIDALPRNSMGKVQKNVLRERYGSDRA